MSANRVTVTSSQDPLMGLIVQSPARWRRAATQWSSSIMKLRS
jgi:hypothetical protein